MTSQRLSAKFPFMTSKKTVHSSILEVGPKKSNDTSAQAQPNLAHGSFLAFPSSPQKQFIKSTRFTVFATAHSFHFFLAAFCALYI